MSAEPCERRGPGGQDVVLARADRDPFAERLLGARAAAQRLHELALERPEGVPQELRAPGAHLADDRLDLAVLEGEADDAPGEPGAVEVAGDLAEAVALEGR